MKIIFGVLWFSLFLLALSLLWRSQLNLLEILQLLEQRLSDAVNFGCGLIAIRQRDYAAGTENRLMIFGLYIIFMLLGFAITHDLNRRKISLRKGEGETL